MPTKRNRWWMSPLFGGALGVPYWMLEVIADRKPGIVSLLPGEAYLTLFALGVVAVVRANVREFPCEEGKPDPLWVSLGVAGSLVVAFVIVVMSMRIRY